MDLSKLQELGGFVPSTPVKQEVTWQPPVGESVTFTVHIKKLSAGAIERLYADPRRKRSVGALFISEVLLLGENADQVMPFDSADQLDPSLANVLLDAIDVVNPRSPKKVAAAKN